MNTANPLDTRRREVSTSAGRGEAALGSLLGQLSMERFSGRLDLQGPSGTVWSFYLCLGRFVWQTGGQNAYQRWRRLLSQYCPGVDEIEIQSLVSPQELIREYAILSGLLQRQQITRTQLVSLIEESLQEVLFDLLQDVESHIQSLVDGEDHVAYQLHPDSVVQSPLTLIRSELALKKAHEQWQQWKAAGLAAVSPNMMPIICRPDLLKQDAPQNYEVLQRLINGQRSLRTLALKMRQDLLSLSQTLNGYVAVGIMSFAEYKPTPIIPEEPTTEILKEPVKIAPLKTNPTPTPAPNRPLVVCIDDSPIVCKTLEGILTQLGYRFQSVQDPLQAIPTLLKAKPDLVFLDLVMPIANGYEICAQIRRAAALKQVPVVILTGNDGLVDRMRAGMVGATDFLAKPVDAERIGAILHKHVPLKKSV